MDAEPGAGGRLPADGLHALESGAGFASYDELYRWSVDDLEGFWPPSRSGRRPLVEPAGAGARRPAMPGARWFPGGRLNYAEHLLFPVGRGRGIGGGG